MPYFPILLAMVMVMTRDRTDGTIDISNDNIEKISVSQNIGKSKKVYDRYVDR